MKEEINTLELFYIVQELQELIGSKVEKVYQLDEKTILFTLHTTQGKRYLHIRAGKYIYAGAVKPTTPEEPTGFCTYLRKKLLQTRLRAIEQVGFERIIRLTFETKTGTLFFYGEFFQPGNIILCEQDTILSALQQHHIKERSIRPKQQYTLPSKEIDLLKATDDEIKTLIHTKNTPIGKVLASNFLLGSIYADHLLEKADIAKEKNASELDTKKVDDIVRSIKGVFSEKKEPQILYENGEVKEILPFAIKKFFPLEKKTFLTYNAACDHVFTAHAQEKRFFLIQSQKQKEIEKVEKILFFQQKELETLKKEIGENQQKGERIYEKFHEIDTFLQQLQQARKTLSWKDAKERYKGKTILVDVDEKNGDVILDL